MKWNVRGPIASCSWLVSILLSSLCFSLSSLFTSTITMAATASPMSAIPPPTPPTSPPRTPIESKPRTPNSDDSSIIDDLSFDYVFDHEGNYVRLSKGSSSKSNHSSPPTPPDKDLLPKSLSPPPRRVSLSRSESAHAALNVPPSDSAAARSFQRVTSGPALSSHKARPFPRRVTLEESKPRPLSATGLSRPSRITDASSEKENIESDNNDHLYGHSLKSSVTGASARAVPARTGYSRPLLPDSHQRQIFPGPNRAGRIMKSISFGLGLSKPIPESHSTALDDDYETDIGMLTLHTSLITVLISV
jgi:serine/threonine-protein kinase TTK/MPS1